MFDHYGEESEEQRFQTLISRELGFGVLGLLSGCCGLVLHVSALSVVNTVLGGALVVGGVLKLRSRHSNSAGD
jgi:uncharacterized membrane protein HdeD (DUF308 family)